jgi:molybdate transport system permease protein
MSADDWQLIWFTAWASALAVFLIVPPGLFLAWLLARKQWRGKSIAETFVSLPLVLPPVATGLILLKIFGRRGPVGSLFHETLGMDVAFTWIGVVVALAVMSFPLLVRSARVAFEEVDHQQEEIAAMLGAGPMRVFLTVTLPLAARGVAGGLMLAYARALGEFGATIMLAGNIPGVTSTLSLSIYQSVQTGDDARAYALLMVSVILAFGSLWLNERLVRRKHPGL